MYTLQVVCPHCTRVTAISDWPHTDRTPVVFTCLAKHGGCGGQAYMEPPDVRNMPNLEVAIVTPAPLTPEQAAYATSAYGQP